MRKKFLTLALSSAALALASCAADASGESTDVAAVAGGEAIELDETSPFVAHSYGSFDRPWALDFDPVSGMIVLTEKSGTMKLVDPASGRTGAITGGIPAVRFEGQGGLGDVVFAPDFAQSGMIYLSWAKPDGEKMGRAAVGRGKLVCEDGGDCTIADFAQIWQQEPASPTGRHYGHRIAFSPDGQHLFISSGDRGLHDKVQDRGNTLGSVVRLLPDGTPAPGNPFADEPYPTNQIWSWGHRNPLGLAFNIDGELWDVEHGPAGGDELNLVKPGANFGWVARSNGNHYNGTDIPDHTADDGFAKPAIFWDPVIAPGDMMFYSGEMFADWRGQALIANLAMQSISRIAVDAASNSATEEARYEFPMRLRGIAQGPDGAIWVIEDGEDGRLLRLTPKASAQGG